MKYIKADKILALIDAKIQELGLSGSTWVGRSVLHDLRSDITSLQQEQSEVDLEREIRDYFSKWDYDPYHCVITMDNDIVATLSSILTVARHFYELGLKARKEE